MIKSYCVSRLHFIGYLKTIHFSCRISKAFVTGEAVAVDLAKTFDADAQALVTAGIENVEATQADTDAIAWLGSLNQAATAADTVLETPLADETREDQEADNADVNAQELATDDFATFGVAEDMRLIKVEPRQPEVD
jgi:hypothetical protein